MIKVYHEFYYTNIHDTLQCVYAYATGTFHQYCNNSTLILMSLTHLRALS